MTLQRTLAAALAALALAAGARTAFAADQTPLKDLNSHPATFGSSDTVGVAHGGTSSTSFTAHCVLIGEGSSAPHVACPSSAGQVLTDNGASSDPSFAAPTGGVTSVSLTLPAIFSVSGSPVTSSGGFTVTFSNETANLIFAGPSSGSPGVPSFRSLVSADFPSNVLALAGLAQIGADTFLGNASGSTANVTAISWPSCSGASQALTYNTTTHAIGCQSPVGSVSGANPFAIGSAQIGVDSATGNANCLTSAGEGSLCLDDANGLAYSMWASPSTSPARVQEKAATSFTVTLTSTPTVGNMLVANCFSLTAVAAANTGWTSFGTQSSSSGDEPYVQSVWHLVNGSDTTSQTPCTNSGGATTPGATITELSNIDPAWTSSFSSVSYAENTAFAPGSISVSTSHSTAAANSIVIAAAGTNSSNNTAGNIAPTYNSGYSNFTGAGAGTNPSVSTASQFVSGSGTSVTATATNTNPSGSSQIGITVVLIELQPNTNTQTTGYQQVSYFTTVKNSGGSSLTSNVRTLKCGSGVTCTCDAQGNCTITSP